MSESNGYCSVIIEKKTNTPFTFWARTVDGLAKAGEDYEGFDEKITMKADEKEREVWKSAHHSDKTRTGPKSR